MDVTAKYKDAGLIAQLIEEQIQKLEANMQDLEGKVGVQSIVTDGAAVMRAARSRVVDNRPYILALDCTAHKVRYLCADVFGCTRNMELASSPREACRFCGASSHNKREVEGGKFVFCTPG